MDVTRAKFIYRIFTRSPSDCYRRRFGVSVAASLAIRVTSVNRHYRPLLTLRKGVDSERTISSAEEPRHLAEKVKVSRCLFYVSPTARVTSGRITQSVYSTPGSPQDESHSHSLLHTTVTSGRITQSQFTPHQGHLRTNHTVYSTPGSPQDESHSLLHTRSKRKSPKHK